MIKRIFDFVFSALALLFLSPVFITLGLMVLIFLGRPILFKQKRIGREAQAFQMRKFRTMKDSRDINRELLPDADRLLSFGKFLRYSSLDELPGLWSVLKGDMSIVGPRPLLQQYLPLYSKKQARRHEVKPGITGWAQINGRNAISWNEKFSLDVWYVDNHTIWLDIKIILLTVKKVITRDGISASNDATMPAFTGNNDLHKVNEDR